MNREVAEAIGTTEHVVKNYLRVIYNKLGLWNRVELALWYESRRSPSVLVTQESFVGVRCPWGPLRGMRRPRRAFEPASRAFRITRNQKLEDAAAVLRRLSFPGVLRRRATHAPDRSSFQLRHPSSTDRIERAWHRHTLWRRPSTATSPPQRRCVPCHWFRSDNVAPRRVLRRRFPPEFPPVGSSRGLESGAG